MWLHPWRAAVVLTLTLCGCESAARVGAPREDYGPLMLEFAGCESLRRDGVCELPEEQRAWTFWAPTEEALEVRADDALLTCESLQRVDHGMRCRVQVPRTARTLTVLANETRRRFALTLATPPADPLLDEVERLRKQGRTTAAAALLAPRMDEIAPALRGRASGEAGRLALVGGKFAEAAELLRAGAEHAYAAGRTTIAVYDATALAYLLSSHLYDYAAARSVLVRAAEQTAEDPVARALLPHYTGNLALETGDLRTALRDFREAVTRTRRLDLHPHDLHALQGQITTLAALGRHHEAISLWQQVVESLGEVRPCDPVDALEQLVWLGIVARVRPGDASWAVIDRAERAAAEHVSACEDPWLRRNHVLNAGLLAHQAGDLLAARAALDRLATLEGGEDPKLSAQEQQLRGQLALARAEPQEAITAFRRAHAIARRSALWENGHLAQIGLASALERRGDLAGAISAYETAEHMLDDQVGGVPLGEGLGGFVHDRAAAVVRLVDLLVRARKPERALAAAERARARYIRTLALFPRIAQLDAATRAQWDALLGRYRTQRAALEQAESALWKLPASELPKARAAIATRRREVFAELEAARALLAHAPPDAPARTAASAPLRLTLFPTRDRVLAFLGGHEVAELPSPDAAQAEPARARWLEPLRGPLTDARELEVALHGPLHAFDLHALRLDGEPLVERIAIAYSVGTLPGLGSGGKARALVVADPTSDLPGALAEGTRVHGLLAERYQVQLLTQRSAARDVVLRELAEHHVYHYAGHAQFAGREGIESGLRLSDGWISLGDVLTLPHVPALVVLAACDGTQASGSETDGFGIAEAFVAAGTSEVVAATRPVADTTTRALVEAFYSARARDPTRSAAATLREAQRALRQRDDQADWAAFRVLVP